MASARQRRKQAIREIVRGKKIRTQADLVAYLRELDCEATQATISRDIAELGLEKGPDGVYELPETHRLRVLVKDIAKETRHALNQVLILTDPGTASSVAAALDAASPEGVLGCIAGDDTVLVICADETQAKHFQSSIDELMK